MPGLYPPIGSSGGYNEQYRRHSSRNKLKANRMVDKQTGLW